MALFRFKSFSSKENISSSSSTLSVVASEKANTEWKLDSEVRVMKESEFTKEFNYANNNDCWKKLELI
jgi:hypothetical protein